MSPPRSGPRILRFTGPSTPRVAPEDSFVAALHQEYAASAAEHAPGVELKTLESSLPWLEVNPRSGEPPLDAAHRPWRRWSNVCRLGAEARRERAHSAAMEQLVASAEIG